jgi:hypothetical protein
MRMRLGGRSDDPRVLWAFALLATLGVAIPLLVAWFAPSDARTGEAFIVWLIIAYSAARLTILALQGEMKLLSLTFWIFVYVWLGVAPFAQLMNNEFPLPGYYPPSKIIFATVVVALGLVSFEFGLYIASRIRLRRTGADTVLLRRVSTTRTILLAVLAVACSSYLVWRFGGPSAFMASRRDVFFVLASVTGTESQEMLQLLLKSLRVPPFVAMLLLWWTWMRHRAGLSSYRKLAILILLCATTSLNVLLNNPVNSPRYWFGMIVLSLAFISIPWRKSWSFSVWTAFLIGVMIVLFPYADIFRRTIDTSDLHFRGMDSVVSQSHYDAFQQTINAATLVEEEGPCYGRQMMGTVLFWVPRRVWPDKPIPSGRLVAEHLGYQYTNISMPLWGEAYLDGGLVFTAIILFFYGVFLGTAERLFTDHISRKSSSPELFGVLVPVLAAYQLYLLRGTLMSAFAYLVPVVVLFIIVSKPMKMSVIADYDPGAMESYQPRNS